MHTAVWRSSWGSRMSDHISRTLASPLMCSSPAASLSPAGISKEGGYTISTVHPQSSTTAFRDRGLDVIHDAFQSEHTSSLNVNARQDDAFFQISQATRSQLIAHQAQTPQEYDSRRMRCLRQPPSLAAGLLVRPQRRCKAQNGGHPRGCQSRADRGRLSQQRTGTERTSRAARRRWWSGSKW